MASPPTDYYVDPLIAANSGTGTIGDPYGDLQYALNTVTRDATDGDRFNIKAGTAEILAAALSLTTYGTPSFSAPLIFQGYTAAQGDRGVGAINCNGATALTNAGDCINWYDLEVYGGPAAGTLITMAEYSTVAACYIHDSTGNGVTSAFSHTTMIGNHFEDLGDGTHDMVSVSGSVGAKIVGNYFNDGGTRNCRHTINLTISGATVINNIISIDGASNGIHTDSVFNQCIIGNTILSAAGTGIGIYKTGSNVSIATTLFNNYVEGFSGAGGVGYSATESSNGGGVYGQNAAFNNTTDYSVSGEHYLALGDNEALGVTGIAKSGADTFANRFVYFSPVDTGNMQTGGYPEA